MSSAQVLCFPGTEVTGTRNLVCVFISACLAERRGLGLWNPHTARPNTSCQLKFRENKERFSTKKSCLHSGATLLQVEIRVALSFESLRDGEVEELRAPTPILGYARQIYLV